MPVHTRRRLVHPYGACSRCLLGGQLRQVHRLTSQLVQAQGIQPTGQQDLFHQRIQLADVLAHFVGVMRQVGGVFQHQLDGHADARQR